jgi:hypothetical protein
VGYQNAGVVYRINYEPGLACFTKGRLLENGSHPPLRNCDGYHTQRQGPDRSTPLLDGQ